MSQYKGIVLFHLKLKEFPWLCVKKQWTLLGGIFLLGDKNLRRSDLDFNDSNLFQN